MKASALIKYMLLLLLLVLSGRWVMASGDYQFRNLWIEDPLKEILLPTQVTVIGDGSELTDQKLRQIYPFVRNVRAMNLEGLEQFQHQTELPDGTTFSYKKVWSKEEVIVTFPGVPVLPEKGEISIVRYIPAFEAVDQYGNLIGLVLCLYETWSPPYLFVPCNLYYNSTAQSPYGAWTVLNPFGFENWAAGPTNSPTDAPLYWDGSTRPFTGNLKDIVFFTSPNSLVGQLTDLAAHGESVPQVNTTDNSINNISMLGGAYAYYTHETPPVPPITNTDIWVWWAQNFVYDSYNAETLTLQINGNLLGDFSYAYGLRGSGNQFLAGQHYINTIDPYDGGLFVTPSEPPSTPGVSGGVSSWTFSQTMDNLGYTLSGFPPGQSRYAWGTITDKQIGAAFWARMTNSPQVEFSFGTTFDSSLADGNGLCVSAGDYADWASPPVVTQYIEEKIYINGQTYIITPSTVDDSSFLRVINCYLRYYDTGILLASIQREHTKWQYGIYKNGIWTFPTEFPIASTDPSSPIYNAHIIPRIQYQGSPVYCLGTFRLIRQKITNQT